MPFLGYNPFYIASSPIISAVMFRQQRSHSGMHEAVIIADGTVDIALTARP